MRNVVQLDEGNGYSIRIDTGKSMYITKKKLISLNVISTIRGRRPNLLLKIDVSRGGNGKFCSVEVNSTSA